MAAAALPYAISGAQTALGIGQTVASRRRRRRALENLQYDIPSATLEQVQMARERASRRGLPGEDITRSRIQSEAAGTLERGESVAESAADVLGLYGKVFGQQADTERGLLEAGAQYQDRNEQDLMRSLGLLSEAEGQQFYYNEFVPFLSDMGYAGEQAQGGATNIAAGLQGAYDEWNNQWMMDQYKDLYGFGDNPGTQPDPSGFVSSYYNQRGGQNPWDATRPPELATPPQPTPRPYGEMNQGYRTPINEAPQNNWQDLPEWQKQNPVDYPASWMKYYNR